VNVNHSETAHNVRSEKKWRTVNVWSVKGPLLILVVILTFFDNVLGWGRAPIAAGVAMLLPIVGYRDFWNEGRFWITVGLLGVAQVPLVIEAAPLMEKLKFPFMFTFGILDCVLVALAISWVCSEHN
jgi:nicotinamide riboside transporter PnuC